MPRAPVFLLLGLCGCASGGLAAGGGAPTTTNVDTSMGTVTLSSIADQRVATHDLAAPPERVWAALPAAFGAAGLAGGVMSEQTRLFGTELLRSRGRLAGVRASRFLDCGKNPIGAPAADLYELETIVRASVLPRPDGTSRLQVHVEATAAPPSGGTRARCTSTGALEDRIVAGVRGAAAGA